MAEWLTQLLCLDVKFHVWTPYSDLYYFRIKFDQIMSESHYVFN